MNKNKFVTLEEFHTKYTELIKIHSELKARLKDAYKLAKLLAKSAEKLYIAGTKSL